MAQSKSRAKTKPRANASRKSSASGWEEYTSGFGTKWEPAKEGEQIEGIVTAKKELPPMRKGADPGGVVEVHADDGHTYSVFKSSALSAWFEQVDVGDTVRVIFEGILKLKGNRKLKLLRGFIKS
jgi:hypothetical protein